MVTTNNEKRLKTRLKWPKEQNSPAHLNGYQGVNDTSEPAKVARGRLSATILGIVQKRAFNLSRVALL